MNTTVIRYFDANWTPVDFRDKRARTRDVYRFQLWLSGKIQLTAYIKQRRESARHKWIGTELAYNSGGRAGLSLSEVNVPADVIDEARANIVSVMSGKINLVSGLRRVRLIGWQE